MDIAFTPSVDVALIVNTLLDKFEQRVNRNTDQLARSIKVSIADLPLPAYFSQSDPSPRFVANEQLIRLEQANLLGLAWLPGEIGHLLESVSLPTEHASRTIAHETLYGLLNRKPASHARARLESILLAEQFRFTTDDWRARAIQRILDQLRNGKSPAPFSLADTTWNLDLLTALSALSTLEKETPYRVFSVRTFNDSKRLEDLKSALVRLARRANSEWKSLSSEEILRELNLVANSSYIHLAGNWQLATQNGEILSLSGFTPSVGFPAAQVETIQAITVHAGSVLCIENLTSFYEFLSAQAHSPHHMRYAVICLLGNPSPAIRRLLRLLPETTPIHLWADLDYGGFNILAQLRKYVRLQTQPHRMDISTFEAHMRLSRPLNRVDIRNLRLLCTRPELADVWPTIQHLINRGLKLEQEAIQV